MVEGVFKIAEKLYGLSFVQRTDIQKYHKDVTTYEVHDRDGSFLAVFYADFFPRKGNEMALGKPATAVRKK